MASGEAVQGRYHRYGVFGAMLVALVAAVLGQIGASLVLIGLSVSGTGGLYLRIFRQPPERWLEGTVLYGRPGTLNRRVAQSESGRLLVGALLVGFGVLFVAVGVLGPWGGTAGAY